MIELKQYVVSIMGTNSFLLMDKDTKVIYLKQQMCLSTK